MSTDLKDLTLCQFEFKESRLEPGSFHHFLFYVDERHQSAEQVLPHRVPLVKQLLEQVAQGPFTDWVVDLYGSFDEKALEEIGVVEKFERQHKREFLLFTFPDPVSGWTLRLQNLDQLAQVLDQAPRDGEVYLRLYSDRHPLETELVSPPWLHPTLEAYLNHRHQYALTIGIKAHPLHIYIMGDEGFYGLIEPYRMWLRDNLRLLDGRP